MIRVAKDDVLRGLKRCKRLAKQDLLASELTANPAFWSAQAEARRSQYTELMETVNSDGVENAYEKAKRRYASLPRLAYDEVGSLDPDSAGRRMALEMFFTMLGTFKTQVSTTSDGLSAVYNNFPCGTFQMRQQ